MTKASNYWVIGKEAEDAWRTVSEENRHKAGVRFSIVEEPSRVSA